MAFLCSTAMTHFKRREVQIPHYHIKRVLAALSAGKEKIQELRLLLEHRSTANIGLRNPCLLHLMCCPCRCARPNLERDSAKWDILRASGWTDTQAESLADVQTGVSRDSYANFLPLGHTLVDQLPLRATN